MHKRSVALRHLPGPKYPFLLGFMELVERKDVHRYATELAEQFGPIFKFRIMCFHVRTYNPCTQPGFFHLVWCCMCLDTCPSSYSCKTLCCIAT